MAPIGKASPRKLNKHSCYIVEQLLQFWILDQQTAEIFKLWRFATDCRGLFKEFFSNTLKETRSILVEMLEFEAPADADREIKINP